MKLVTILDAYNHSLWKLNPEVHSDWNRRIRQSRLFRNELKRRLSLCDRDRLIVSEIAKVYKNNQDYVDIGIEVEKIIKSYSAWVEELL